MLSYFLDGQPCPGPLNMDGLTLRKGRSRTFWGFLYRKLGYVDGLSDLQFTDDESVEYLRAVFAQHSVQGETTFRIDEDGQTVYDGSIDYTRYRFDGRNVSIALTDNRAVVDLETAAASVLGVMPSETISLHAHRLGGLPQLVTDPNALTVQRSQTGSFPITHGVPFTKQSDTDDTVQGTLAAVIVPTLSDPIYYNTTAKEQIVQLTGIVSVTASASTSVTATLTAVAKGTENEAVPVGRYAITSTPAQYDIVVNVRLRVLPGQSLKLEWTGSGNVNRYVFAYNDATRLSVTDENYPASIGYGLNAHSLFAQLVSQSSGGKLSFFSQHLTDNPVFIANGAGVRGLQRPMPVSLAGLYTGLNCLMNLQLWVDGDTVYLEPKDQAPKGSYRIEELLSLTETVATDYLYNSVRVGYTDWRSDGTLSNEEINGQRQYTTSITTVRSELNLLSELIGASALIEQQRRKQFDPKQGGSGKSDALDDRLFVIAARPTTGTDYVAERLEAVSSLSGPSEPETLYNLRYTPARNLSRFLTWLSGSGSLTLDTQQGSTNLMATINNQLIDERAGLDAVLTAPMRIDLETPMTLGEFASLPDEIEYRSGPTYKTAILLDASWRKTATGATATLTLLQR